MGNVADGTDWYWDILSALYGRNQIQRVGNGATVPRSHVQAHARARFLDALNRLAPNIVQELVTPDALALLTEFNGRSSREESVARLNAWGHLVVDWQARHNLAGNWLKMAAHVTMMAAVSAGFPANPSPDLLAAYPAGMPLIMEPHDLVTDVHEGKQKSENLASEIRAMTEWGTFRWTPPHKLVDVPVYLDDLKHPPYEHVDGYEEEDEGEFGTFDPRTETVKEAEARLLEALRPRLRRTLESIKAEDQVENGTIEPVTFRKPTAFEWLLRFQVLGESRAEIARELATERGKDDPAFYRSHVGREIKRVANLIGLTLRDAKPDD